MFCILASHRYRIDRIIGIVTSTQRQRYFTAFSTHRQRIVIASPAQ
jgi:hypothetical protein